MIPTTAPREFPFAVSVKRTGMDGEQNGAFKAEWSDALTWNGAFESTNTTPANKLLVPELYEQHSVGSKHDSAAAQSSISGGRNEQRSRW